MIIEVMEPKQYKSTYYTFTFKDVVEIRTSKDGKYKTLFFEDGTKSRRLAELVKVIRE